MRPASAWWLMFLGVCGCRTLVGFDDAVERAEGSAAGASSGTAGASGASAGASSQTGGATAVSNVLLVDDFEDGNLALGIPDTGSWQIYDDEEGPGFTLEIDDGGHDSDSAMRIRGGPQRGWGASLLGPFRAVGVEVGTYLDASDYDGVQMWVRDSSGAPSSFLGVGVGDSATEEEGGICTVCFDRFLGGVSAGPNWQLVQIRWEDMDQVGFGVPQTESPETSELVLIGMSFFADATYDIRVDDIAFFAE